MNSKNIISRRSFMQTSALTVAASALAASNAAAKPNNIKLGFDNFSVRACKWKAPQLIEYAASLNVDTLMMSDLGVYESLDESYLKKIKAMADKHGVELQAGTGSICPTSKAYRRQEPAVEHAKTLIRVAKTLGTDVARCYLGTRADREGDGGIYRHIEEMVKVCKAVESYAKDAGVKLAIENHAGDLQAWELKMLIEEAGKDYVGCTIDSGNATWTIEDPLVNLEILGPYSVSAGQRDSAVWETEEGAKVMWCNMGDGTVDWQAYMKRYKELCPDCPFVLEILSYTWERDIPYLKPEFWDVYPKARASEFARFVAMAKRGEKYTIPAERPKSANQRSSTPEQQKWDLERSLAYCREVLGMGRK
ncbi:TIM barrel protein [bacterium]|nr:TIM barrel protein [bacterium]